MENLQRPDGSVVTPIGWAFISLGVIGVIVAAAAESINAVIIGFGLANLGIGLGVLLLSLGYLVRAIWFLPGREIRASELNSKPVSVSSCGWCGRQLPSGYKTCTSYDHGTLRQVSEKVVDPVCKGELQKRGYPVAVTPKQEVSG
jgi:hypothetical protein